MKKKNSTVNLEELTAAEKAAMIVEKADDAKAHEIEDLDIRAKSSVTSHIVVCTGTSDTHMKSVADKVEEGMKEHGVRPIRRDKVSGSGWLLLDYGDVIFHVMLEEKRQFYDLETLWTTMEPNPDLVD